MPKGTPFDSPSKALYWLVTLTPQELRQQANMAAKVIKTKLDEENDTEKLQLLTDQNEALKQQVQALKQQVETLQADITALQFKPEPEPEKKRGRKTVEPT